MEFAVCQIEVISRRYGLGVGSDCFAWSTSSNWLPGARASPERVGHASIRSDEIAIQWDHELVRTGLPAGRGESRACIGSAGRWCERQCQSRDLSLSFMWCREARAARSTGADRHSPRRSWLALSSLRCPWRSGESGLMGASRFIQAQWHSLERTALELRRSRAL